jgi:divalent metal cation (Fe/Co/Zn/Cd) transporter
LLGFGLDSFVEVASACVVIWQFRARVPEQRERLALRGIAVSFLALAAWVGADALRTLLDQDRAGTSPIGIGVAATSLVVMPLLVRAKRRTGRELGSATVVADSVQTMLCTWLSAVVLVGLLLNGLLGWWWADPVAALAVAAVAAREGVAAWRGEQCDDCALPTADTPATAPGACGCAPGCADACCTDSERTPSG